MGKVRLILAVVWILVGLAAHSASAAPPLQSGAITYESQPDEAALYLSDIAFVRDRVTLPVSQETRVRLPPGTYPSTLVLTENGERVRDYRLTPQAGETTYGSLDIALPGTAYSLTWDSAEGEAEQREIVLEYLLSGASWSPTYDMRVLDEDSVDLAFFAEIHNTGLVLDTARVYLVAGRVDLSQQIDQTPVVTANQYIVGYENQTVALPTLGVGALDLQHVYAVDSLTALPGDIVYTALADATLDARRLYVWNAAAEQEVDAIYKVLNEADVPLAEGVVRIYQDNLFMGSDFVETTPIGSEGSITVGSLPDVRVRRSASRTLLTDDRSRYQHDVTLEIANHAAQDLQLTVLDRWDEAGWGFEFSETPQRQPDSLDFLQWDVSVPAGETLTLTYTYFTWD